ncbi:MAG: hypothetical protein J6A79_05670 [Clostridia bacterium]|nr:hypothetical protein [Clostridia bacterium]
MLDNVRANDVLLPVEVIPWDGGTDIWLRRNIQGPLTDETEEGLSGTYYVAEEVFLRVMDRALTKEEVEADFDRFWILGEAYDPRKEISPPDLAAVIMALKEQNEIILECLLEMSEAVYS